MKLLLYCTKSKPYLAFLQYWAFGCYTEHYGLVNSKAYNKLYDFLNGKIIAECDYEVEEISVTYADYYHEELAYNTNTLSFDDLLEKSCLDNQQLDNYLYGNNGYAIHIKNLHIFYEPKELKECVKPYNKMCPIIKAPQNMQKVWFSESDEYEDYILLSIRPEWLCEILKEKKTIEVRKKVLQVMKDEI